MVFWGFGQLFPVLLCRLYPHVSSCVLISISYLCLFSCPFFSHFPSCCSDLQGRSREYSQSDTCFFYDYQDTTLTRYMFFLYSSVVCLSTVLVCPLCPHFVLWLLVCPQFCISFQLFPWTFLRLPFVVCTFDFGLIWVLTTL